MNMAPMQKRVAIIGAGPAGLVSAKYALEYGLFPVIFDRKHVAGGLWTDGTAIWDQMHTNVSKFSVSFSDYPWPETSSIIPSAKDVFNYLIRYTKHFGLENYLCLNSSIESVRQLPNKKWQVTWSNVVTKECMSEVFDFVVCATGLHTKPKIPDIEGAEEFQGSILHSANFRSNDARLRNKRVVVVGNSYSGVEISSNLVGHCQSVVNVFKRPYLVFPRLLKFQVERNMFRIIPIDLLFSRDLTYSNRTPEEERLFKIGLYRALCPHQTDPKKAHPAMYYELDNDEPIREAVTDNYYPYINTGQIKPIKAHLSRFDAQGLHLDDGSYEPADAVIFCTGYSLSLDYFEPSVLKTLKFDQRSRVPIILYKYTVHPDLTNLAMVGTLNGLFFAGFENQARWVMQLFAGIKRLPSRDLVDEEMREEEMMREHTQNNQYPHGAYNRLIDKLAFESGCLPNFQHFVKTDFALYRMLWYNGTLPVHFSLNHRREQAIKTMKEVDEITRRVYYMSDDDLMNLTTFKLAKKFSKYYKIPMHLFKDEGKSLSSFSDIKKYSQQDFNQQEQEFDDNDNINQKITLVR